MPRREAGLSSSSLRHPRLQVLANSVVLGGVLEASVSSNSHYAADRFRLRAALSSVDPGVLSAADLRIEVLIGVDTGFRSLIVGLADRIDIDAIGGTVEIEGRDFCAGLIEARIQQTFSNQTSSEIALGLAQGQGLAADVAPTTTPVGRYYQSEHDQVALDQFCRATTQWDLLVFLAQHEGFDVWVSGSTLHFQPAAVPPVSRTIVPADCISLRMQRSLTLASDIEVVVKSWNSRQQSAFVQVARQSGHRGGGGGGSGGRTQRYVYVRPNLLADQALQLAERILADLSRHERVVQMTMPGDLVLAPRGMVAIGGTGTDFDQVYQVAEIERELSVERGFVQQVRVKNTTVTSASTIPAGIAG